MSVLYLTRSHSHPHVRFGADGGVGMAIVNKRIIRQRYSRPFIDEMIILKKKSIVDSDASDGRSRDSRQRTM
jgi:hypothetical protein